MVKVLRRFAQRGIKAAFEAADSSLAGSMKELERAERKGASYVERLAALEQTQAEKESMLRTLEGNLAVRAMEREAGACEEEVERLKAALRQCQDAAGLGGDQANARLRGERG